MDLTTTQLVQITLAQILHKQERHFFKGVSIDSRELDLKDKIFFAIVGKRFDGHNFLQQALEAGASTFVVHTTQNLFKFPVLKGITIIKVDDTLKALHRLASYWRKKNQALVIGITGSVGKTTTKNFCLQLLKKSFVVMANQKSFNNTYGVPLTLLSITKEVDILIQEIGMNQYGEISFLSQLVEPDIVTVTQVACAHIGILGSTHQIAQEKKQIYLKSPKALPVFNLDNFYTSQMYQYFLDNNPHKKFISFSAQDKKADVFLQIKQIKKSSLLLEGHIQGVLGEVWVPITGAAHLNNLLAACAISVAAGLESKNIWNSLLECELPAGRNQWVKLHSGAQALFDAYNSSPESVMALLDHFLSPIIKQKKFLILGDFLELGSEFLEVFQQKVAMRLAQNDVSLIWFIGAQANSFSQALKAAGVVGEFYFSKNVDNVNSELVNKIVSMLNPSIVVGFKASRKCQLEKILMNFQPVDISHPFV